MSSLQSERSLQFIVFSMAKSYRALFRLLEVKTAPREGVNKVSISNEVTSVQRDSDKINHRRDRKDRYRTSKEDLATITEIMAEDIGFRSCLSNHHK